jgi:geranylgeranyl pyrophosphate synthase
MNLGVAFQIIDDILDYTEDQSTIGKPAGNDLRQGMVTLPLIYALQEAPMNGHQQQIQHLLNGNTRKEEEILAIVDWVTHGYGVEKALQDAEIYAQQAREALYHFPDSPDRAVLDELINFVVRRKR